MHHVLTEARLSSVRKGDITTFGCIGRILRVNLTDGKMSKEELSEGIMRKFFGGRGLGAKILFDELMPGIDPLGPENKLIFATGPVTGAPFTGNAKFAVLAKSPLTGLFGEAYSGGFFGPELKFAGYDAIVFEGKSETPVYLWIRNGEVELRDASHLWGKITGEVQDAVLAEVRDERAKVACIGPGGEKLVGFASIVNDLVSAAGRCGMGAVMGSKKLKAVAVRGTQKLKLADEVGFAKATRMASEEAWGGWGEGFHKHGTGGILGAQNETGRLPTKNFAKGTFDGADKITGETMTETILVNRKACFACRNACKRVVEAEEPYSVDPEYGGPEYETTAAFGSLCMNSDLVSVAKCNELCNKYGIDTISAGVVIAFAMECYEKGLLTKDDTAGVDLTWGNHEAIVRLVEMIAKREGLGNLLADGVKRAADRIGKGAESYAMHVKGLELPMHEPRGKVGVGLSYATSNRGGCHNRSPHDDYWGEGKLAPEIGLTSRLARDRLYTGPEKAEQVVLGQNWWGALDTLIVCIFAIFPGGISIDTLAGIISSVTGWKVTPSELMTVGERAWNIARAFNVREGLTRKEDTLPVRFTEPLPDGLYKGKAIPNDTLQRLLDHYYESRGWNKENGVPTRAKLESLGLKEIADKLEALQLV